MFYVSIMIPTPIYKSISNIPAGTKINPTKFFKTVFDNGDLANNILEGLPREKQFIGTIPRVFFSSLTPKEIPTTALKIRELFADFSQYIYNATISKNKATIEPFKNKLSELIKQNINFEILGKGARANTFKLTIQDKIFTVKTFAPNNIWPIDPLIKAAERICGHGGEIEPIHAKFITHKTGAGITPRFNFGKVDHNNSNDGYIVSRFINEKSKPQIKNTALLHIASPINFKDLIIYPPLNHINGIVYDIGGAELKQHYPNDRETAKFIREICTLADKGNVNKFKNFLKQHELNPKCFDALVYINHESRVNKFFKEAITDGDFTPQQQKILSLIGIRLTPPIF